MGKRKVLNQGMTLYTNLKILLKELRESLVALKIIMNVSLCSKLKLTEDAMEECNHLISIFVKSVATAKKNNIMKKPESK